MGMSAVQSSAFKASSGEMDISTLHLLSLGLLFAVLFLWAAWALLDVWAGWSNEKVRSAMLGRFFIRLTLLLVLSIWMFAS
ncbi:TPA: TIGR03758 family integrating conjugative element protein [Escherichia coli]|nr:TIGR03758 family integrating conjugative element protein [Escherichia coli]